MAATAEGVLRVCRVCEVEKPLEDFGEYQSHGIKKRRHQCRACLRPKMRQYTTESNARRKLEVIQAYGGHCACCGTEYLPHLTVDHIDGGGTQERRSSTTNLYARLRAEGFPPGYQVLCFNCNFAKWAQGACGCSEVVI